jgi:predicted HTH domain antitoxin
MSQIPVMLDKDLLDLLGDSPAQIERNVLETLVLDLYRQRKLPVGRAAKLLGMDQLSFIRWSGARGVPVFDMTTEEWERELRVIEKA